MQPGARAEAGEQGIDRVAAGDDDLGQRVGPQAARRGDARVASAAARIGDAAGREGAVGERGEPAHAAGALVAQVDRQDGGAESAQVAAGVDPA